MLLVKQTEILFVWREVSSWFTASSHWQTVVKSSMNTRKTFHMMSLRKTAMLRLQFTYWHILLFYNPASWYIIGTLSYTVGRLKLYTVIKLLIELYTDKFSVTLRGIQWRNFVAHLIHISRVSTKFICWIDENFLRFKAKLLFCDLAHNFTLLTCI